MTELLELEPRETATEDLDVDAAFSGLVDASRDHTQCPHCCDDDVSQWFFATRIPW
ncbi:hypothetical protein GCM10009839_74950 [Catenulispora yoronensis]|uniref:Uncharacterized protein n=1 Tax=Catenulispora yoronensis TaxID=450799 RepID=A0ABN2V8E9_9ACTN